MLSHQHSNRLRRSVTLVNVVGLFKPCVYSRLPANLVVSLIASFIGPSLYVKAIGFLSLFSEFSR